MRLRDATLVTVVVLLAAACSGEGADETSTTPAPSSTTSSTTTTSTSTTEPPTTTTTTTLPTRVTLTPSNPSVSTGGMGAIRIGMSVEAAEEDAGFELSGEPEPEVAEGCYYVTPPEDETAYAGVAFMVLDGVIARVDVLPGSSVTTLSGAGIGVSEDALAAMFPGQLEPVPEATAGGASGWKFVPRDEEDAGFGVIFVMDGDVISSYRAGFEAAISLIEGCL